MTLKGFGRHHSGFSSSSSSSSRCLQDYLTKAYGCRISLNDCWAKLENGREQMLKAMGFIRKLGDMSQKQVESVFSFSLRFLTRPAIPLLMSAHSRLYIRLVPNGTSILDVPHDVSHELCTAGGDMMPYGICKKTLRCVPFTDSPQIHTRYDCPVGYTY